ncbi:hypothetical protein M9H77_04388 [Catharanthus roseus]|uniref:Uncharacterized protein n=1 Tax=Catharanthus roseus TaxID=4058 RepID=A0ACC0CE43_CATRO|nr:hypothetical protein M9H77_04388 [Catharanthus roseus]
MRDGGLGNGEEHRWFYLLHRASVEEERFSKSRHLDELYKYHTGNKKGQYVDTFLEKFWTEFHEARQKAEDEAAVMDTPIPDDLQLIANILGGLSCGKLYGAGLEAAHLRAESSRVVAGLPLCCLEAE